MQFKGAWEGSFVKYIYELYDFFDLEPAKIIINKHEKQKNEIRAAKTRDGKKIIIYFPFAEEINVGIDLSAYDFTVINLSEKQFGKPRIVCTPEESSFRMPDFNSDGLYIGVLRS